MIDLHGISQAAFDLIVNSEVSSRAVYERDYRRPERPGGQSGITIGIGYDCGYSTAAVIRNDWNGKIPDAMIETLCTVAGLRGQAAQKRLASVRNKVDVPWGAALEGNETDDVSECVCAVAPLPNGDWAVIDFSEFERVSVH